MSSAANRSHAARARAWLAADPDPETRAELAELLRPERAQELAARFAGRLGFGTAGIRAPLGAGPLRMNRLVVRGAVAGLVEWQWAALGRAPRVVVGRDARRNSAAFAAEAARVIADAGGEVLTPPDAAPTPVTAFAVLHYGADAAVMITASHNPAADNGLKVYLADGAQLAPPADAEIAAAIAARDAGGLPSGATPRPGGRVTPLGAEAIAAYVGAAAAASLAPSARRIAVVYTPLHGVGRAVLEAVFAAAGFGPPEVVEEQAEPDPSFPTLAYPNPEEPGALDLAIAQAERRGADLVLANDPDADRLGVAAPDPAAGGRWRALTGDEIGALLADHVLAHTSGADRLVATTVVSSRLLARQAAAAGVHYAETLTGFKWLVRPALARPDLRFVFGYEEALGYAVNPTVRDKDGIAAALLFAELAAAQKAAGRTVFERLDDLARIHGLHATASWSLRAPPAELAARVARLRAAPPAALGEREVTEVRDYAAGRPAEPGAGSAAGAGCAGAAGVAAADPFGGELPPTDLLALHAEGMRVLLRPSGTEPKLKVYAEVVLAAPDPAAARITAAGALAELRAAVDALLAP